METEDTPTLRREIYDAERKESLPGTLVRSEGDDASTDELVNGVYDALGTTFDFFRTAYGRNSLDGQGGPLRATVHYRDKFTNVFWEKGRLVLGDWFSATSTARSSSCARASSSTSSRPA
ncbi:hypothetical protein ACFV0O_32505 [Kitasatospora sp. NPDC059577]|uniref:hypothetical protein n=1 Tax=unclassified Kitasatospora TaxID=2633591 RepID=UPI003691BADB